MAKKYAEKLNNKAIHWNSNLSINSTESDDRNLLDSCSDDQSESGVGQFMYTLFRRQLYTDVTFHSKSGKDSFSAHRVVLAGKCPFFSKLLFGTKAKEAEGMDMRVEISNLPLNVFKDIVEYFYTGEIDLEDVSTLLDVYFGAKRFQVESIVEKCESYIESLELSEDNVCSILQLCKNKNAEELKNRCLSYIKENTKCVIGSVAFEKCIYNTVHEICNLSPLDLDSEEQLLDAVVRWVRARPPDLQPELIHSLLPSIRFLTFSGAELGSIFQKHSNIMPAEDALKIIIFLADPPESRNFQNLPTWCNKNTQRRNFKQNNIASGLKGRDLTAQRSRKLLISLKPPAEFQVTTEQSSRLQMECVEGAHHIKAVKFLFRSLPQNESIEVVVSVRVMKEGVILLRFKKYFINLQREKLFRFNRAVNVRRGQIVSIQVTAKSAKPFGVFELDGKQDWMQNGHFKSSVTCESADKKQFIIGEVVYES